MKETLQQTKQAFKRNIGPGSVLWVFMLAFFVIYVKNESFRNGLEKVSLMKSEIGYPFSFAVYVISAALLPEILKIVFFQKCRISRENLYNFAFFGVVFGFCGILTDVFYNYQAIWFGSDNKLTTLLLKALIDQGVYSPIANFLLIAIFFWRENRFATSVFAQIFTPGFIASRLLPVVVAGWCVWIPGVMLVYSMPTQLQLPVASLILCFWVLIFSFFAQPQQAIEKAPGEDIH